LGVLHPNLFLSKAGETLPAFCVYLRWPIQKPAVCFTGYDTPPIASLEEICKKSLGQLSGVCKKIVRFLHKHTARCAHWLAGMFGGQITFVPKL
jgi:hypothetical protein